MKLLAIGLDGTTIEALKLFNMTNVFSDSEEVHITHSVYPEHSFPAFASILTGKDPGSNGVWNVLIPEGNKLTIPSRNSLRYLTFLDWLALKGKKVCSINVPLTEPVSNRYDCVGSWLSPNNTKFYSNRMEELIRSINYRTYLPFDVNISELHQHINAKEKLAIAANDKYNYDFMMLHFTETEVAQHRYPSFFTDQNHKYQVSAIYSHVNDAIQTIHNAIQPEGIVFFSDHGFECLKGMIDLNDILHRIGMLNASYSESSMLELMRQGKKDALLPSGQGFVCYTSQPMIRKIGNSIDASSLYESLKLSCKNIVDVIPKHELYNRPDDDVDDFYVKMPGYRPTGLMKKQEGEYGAGHTHEAFFSGSTNNVNTEIHHITDIPYLICSELGLEYEPQPLITKSHVMNYSNTHKVNLAEKVLWTKMVINDATKMFKNIGVAWTGGKDSTIILDIMRGMFGNVPFVVMQNDTTVKFKETYEFISKLRDEWELNLQIIKPDIPKDFKIHEDREACCNFLKTESIKKAISHLKLDALVAGIRWDEQGARMNEHYFSDRDTHTRIHPILHFTEADVWAYINKYNVPTHPLYRQGYRSIGCEPCTAKAIEGGTERSGRSQDKEEIMTRLREMGYW